MKRILCLAAGFLAVAPVLAEQAVGMPTPIAGPTPTIGELLQTSQGMRAQRASEINTPPEFNWQILVDIGINAPGRFGTFYRSDYFAYNFRGINQEVLVGWIAAGVNNAAAPTMRFSLNASTIYSIPDFLGTGSGRLNQTGVGSILITGVLSGTSTPDTSALLSGSMRISTMENATSTGTNSFTLNAVNPMRIHGDVNAVVYGVRQNNDFRTNYTLVNLDTVNSRAWTVTAIAGNTSSWTVSLPPVSMQQFATPSSVVPTSSGYFVFQFTPTLTTDFQWSVSGQSADNITGDAWHNIGFSVLSTF